ncbi:MAG TPA: hypothetical protein VGD60_11825 [Candidatus Acidoferrales bacterium]
MPSGAIARVEGGDISVEGGAGAAVASAAGVPSFIFNGSVVTVHSGKAKLTFVAGGQVDICGPAKITVLQSAGSITLALSIGRLHLALPAGAPVRIFTPTIIATPINIGGADRDITLGLDLSDSLCVLAKSGALRLEQQFTGEGLIVPQAGDFLIPSGKLVPTAGATGNCDCTEMHAQSAPPPNIPVMGVTSASQLFVPATAPPAAADEAKTNAMPAAEPNVQLRVLAKEDEVHPVPQADKSVPAAAPPPAPPPPTAMPIYKIVMPPLGFSAGSPSPPEDPSLDAVLLVRTVHVEPEYEFTGHVDAPSFATTDSNAGAAKAGKAKEPKPQKSGGGFWAGLKRLFGGG